MERLFNSYIENVEYMRSRLRVEESFDIIERRLKVAGVEMCFLYIDGFIKDGEMQRIMAHFLSQKTFGTAKEIMLGLPYVEVDMSHSPDEIARAVLSGQALILCESFGDSAILVDARTYPARGTAEPDSDRVMQGAHDGFVETLVVNTALIRRRIRDERLTMQHFNLGGASKTDVVVCYMKGLAKEKDLKDITEKLCSMRQKDGRDA